MAEADPSIPKQFFTTLSTFVDALSTCFPECEALKEKKLMLSMASSNDAMHEIITNEWFKNTQPHKKRIAKKDSTLFKEMRKIDFLKDLGLHKKWTDKGLSMQSRDLIWLYIQNLTQLASIHCGEADKETKPLLDAFGRIHSQMGMTAVDESTGNINFAAVGELASKLITDPSSQEAQDMATIYGAVGEMFGNGNPIAMAQQAYAMHAASVGPAAAAAAPAASAAAASPAAPPQNTSSDGAGDSE